MNNNIIRKRFKYLIFNTNFILNNVVFTLFRKKFFKSRFIR